MLKNLTIKNRLIFVISFLSLLMVFIGGAGFISLKLGNASLKTVYEDRLVSLGQLDGVIRPILHNQVELARAVQGAPAEIAAHLQVMDASTKAAQSQLTDYLATYLTEDEKKLAAQFQDAYKKLREEGFDPAIQALKNGDKEGATDLSQHAVVQLYQQVSTTMNGLIALQLDVAKSEYEGSQERFQNFTLMSVVLIACGLCLGAASGVWLIRGISGPLNQAVSVAQHVADGDLTQEITIDSSNETGQLLTALKKMNDRLAEIVGGVRAGTDTIATASAQIAAGNLDLSSRTEQQASSLEETASAMEELTATVKQNAANSRQANQLAMSASTVAVSGGKVVGEVVDTMQSINESAQKIVQIISVIDGIAFQTNILALNAAVEAARAGEQGRGFAVVATEVRSLAQRSATAAKEIKQLIDDSVGKVALGTDLVQEAGRTIGEVVESVKRVTDIMSEISAASQEQSAGIEEVNLAITQMDEVTQQNAALVEEAAAAAQSLQHQSINLTEMVGVFTLKNSARQLSGREHQEIDVTPSRHSQQIGHRKSV